MFHNSANDPPAVPYPGEDVEPRTPEASIALLERRLARSQAAREAAEALLEVKSRVLARKNEELEVGREQLSTSLERRNRQLLDAQRVAAFGTLLWDIGASQLELSPQIRLMLGIDPEAEVHSYRALLATVVVEDRPRLLNWLHHELLGSLRRGRCNGCLPEQVAVMDRSELASCSSPDYRIDVRCRGGKEDEPIRWLRVMAQFEFDSRCRASLIYATVQDITWQVLADQQAALLRQRDEERLKDLEALNADLLAAREAAERANAAKTRFLAMMSHDIRTPLNGVIGMLALLDEATLSDEQVRTLNLVRSSGDQLRVLLNDIIDLARADAGQLQLCPGPADAAAILGQGADFWRFMAVDKMLTLDLDLAPGIPAWIEADQLRLRQLIDNLLSNAIKYTREGGVVVRARHLASGNLRVEVTDTGIGISAERQADLFDYFGRLHLGGSEPGGAGLGLAICKRIVEAMGGTIGVDDMARGSCFWFEVPARPIKVPERVADPAILSLRGEDGRAPRILVAEDLATNRIVVDGYLRKLGCEIVLVEDGQLAVEAVVNDHFDLVLMDMAMPVMDGPEATRRIRALDNGRANVPIIALTAYARPEELAPMMLAGANGAVAKPIVLKVLHDAMREHLYASDTALPVDPRNSPLAFDWDPGI